MWPSGCCSRSGRNRRSQASRAISRPERVIRLPVEAVVLNGASPDLMHRVLRDGILVLDRDRVARLRFEVQARNEFFDMAPVRRLYRRLSA